jgi:hypothetical protein
VILAETVRSNPGGCESEGLFRCGCCGGTHTRHFASHKALANRSQEVWGSSRALEVKGVRCLLCGGRVD